MTGPTLPLQQRRRSTSSEPLDIYLEAVHRLPRIDAATERRLGRTIQAGLEAEASLARDAASTTGEATSAQIERWQRRADRGRLAHEQLVQANLRLVVYVARRYPQVDLSLLDLIQEGSLGLMEAARRYDPERGTRFSTFAVYWIRQPMREALARQGHWLGVPARVRRDLTRLAATRDLLRARLGRRPQPFELAKATGLSPIRVQRLERWSVRNLELDKEVGGKGGARMGDLVAGPESERPEYKAEIDDRRQTLESALAQLEEREAEVLRLGFGLVDGTEWPASAIARRLGLSDSRIRSIRNQALRKLRHPSRGAALRDLAGQESPPRSEALVQLSC